MPDLDLEEQLRSRLHASLGDGPAASPQWDDVDARLGPAVARRRRRLVMAAVVVTAVLVVAVALVAGRPGGERVRTGPVAPGPTASTPTSSAPSGPSSAKTRVVATVPIGGQVAMLARPDGLWYVDSAATSLVHVDPAGRIAGHVTWRTTDSHYGQYSGPVHLASGQGSIWALFWATGTLLRIDPATLAVTGRNVLGGQGSGFEVEGLAVGQGHVWVTVCCDRGPSQRLYRVDPTTMDVDAQVGLPGQGESEAVVAGPQGIFVTGEQFDTVVQVDPSGQRILRQIPVPGGAGRVALGREAYVLGRWDPGSSTGTTLSTIDPSTGTVHLVAHLPSPVQELVATSSSAWVGGVSSTGGVIGPIFSLSGATATPVPGTLGAAGLAASGNVLWYVQDGKAVGIMVSS